jgi:GT2 family glycosyltransferase
MINSIKSTKKSDTEFALGNTALRNGDFIQSIRHYIKASQIASELTQVIASNLSYATRMYRNERNKNGCQKVVVFGWDLAHNAAGRAYTLASIYQEFTDVEIIGTTFPKNGHEIWAPIRESSIKITSITLEDSKNDYKKLLNAVLDNPSDIVHLSKPRISNIVVGILYKKIWDAKVIIDIDDEELAFVDAKKPLALADYIKKYDTTPPLADFAGREWTRIAVGMVNSFDGVTVANEALRSRYGGVVVRHARAQVILERSNLSKSYARAHFGIPAQKKVIIFFGTARPHKGLVEIAKAIVETQRDDLLFLVVGDFPDQSFLTELKNITACPYIFLGIQKIESIPLIMSCADYCILFQNESSVIAQYQTPAKLSDALAQGIPILANRFPAMEMLFDAGAAIEVQGKLSDNINNMVDNARLIERLMERSADLFNREFSFRANAKHLQYVSMVPSARILEKSHEEIIDLFEERQVSFQIDDRTTYKKPLELEPLDVDIVVPVYNALDDVKLCLTSLQAYTDNYTVNVIVVNDGSDESTTQWLRVFCRNKRQFVLIEHEGNLGYTRAVNTGLKSTSAKYVITQNSDTIVSAGWLTGLIRCMESDGNIGIVGPLSNAASWQNVPDLYDDKGAFAVNSLPVHLSLAAMTQAVAIASTRSYPRLPFINGFCFMIKRQLIEAIGYMDEENFPIGYGEENDYCIRAADAGFNLAIADDVYVFHAKSKSFGHDRRKELSKQGSEKLRRKHTAEKFQALLAKVKDTSELDLVRKRIGEFVARSSRRNHSIDFMSMRILFLLPVKGGGGGAHSVVQEVAEMRRLGINAHVGVKQEHLGGFLINYADMPHADTLFAGFDSESLLALAENYDVVVATIFNSMVMVKRIVERNRHILPAYYVQDYEPLFFESGTERRETAMQSYSLVPGALLFAKTHWIIREVAREHKVQVCKVSPSIDHEVYMPRARDQDGRIHVVAMVRPGTPRRGASRTMRVLKALQHMHGEQVAVHIFGCLDVSSEFLTLERDFAYVNHGILKRPEVATLLSGCDIFVDLSDYQAFGRTGLEAMACRCAVVLPAAGGTDEYAIDGENSLVVDTLDEGLCIRRISSLIDDPVHLENIKLSALQTASRYSVHMAAISEILLFTTYLSAHRCLFPKLLKKVGVILPDRMED